MRIRHLPGPCKALFSLLLAFFIPTSLLASDAASERPNVVLILADDLGYGDLASYGHPYAQTPTLDRMAAEGARFTQHYVTAASCVPSRAGIMTGLYPVRFKQAVPEQGLGDTPTLVQLLHAAGYRTGHFGKWSLGPGPEPEILDYALDAYFNEKPERPTTAHRDAEITAAAANFIRENRHSPFYVHLWLHSTHNPIEPPPSLIEEMPPFKVDRSLFAAGIQEKFDQCEESPECDLDSSMRAYLADVLSIDRHVQEVLDALEETGLSGRTLVVFSSDNGPALLVSRKIEDGYNDNAMGYAGNLRGDKHEVYDGGIKVPMIVRWPGHIEAGRIDTASVTSFVDWLPTIASITGIDVNAAGLDGEDISDIWLTGSRPRNNPLFWKRNARTPAVMRDGKWKLHLGKSSRRSSELYDLEADPAESNDLATSEPEVLARLEEKARAWTRALAAQEEAAKP